MPPLESASLVSSPCDASGSAGSPPRPKKASLAAKQAERENPSPSPSSSPKPPSGRSDSEKRGLFRRLGSRANSSREGSPVLKDGSPRSRSLSWTRRNRSASPKKNLLAMDDELQLIEEDPVVALFEARNTQRVRFCLEGKQPTRDPIIRVEPIKETPDPSFNIKSFMGRALFKNGSGGSLQSESTKAGGERTSSSGSLVWESEDVDHGPEVIHTSVFCTEGSGALKLSYAEDPDTRNAVLKCLSKGREAQLIHFRYEYAVKAYVKALKMLTEAEYPSEHPLTVRTRKALNNAHHMLTSYKNSANIVKMGIKYEDSGELIRALKMYTIAYRMRRDQLCKNHSSLVVLLNILGSIQIKRMELQEAMQIFELALKESPKIQRTENDEESPPCAPINLLARAVTYREMGAIHEKWGDTEKALAMYHRSLECTSEWKDMIFKKPPGPRPTAHISEVARADSVCSLDSLQTRKTFPIHALSKHGADFSENGEIEIYIGSSGQSASVSGDTIVAEHYHSFFPQTKKRTKLSKEFVNPTREGYANVDIAMTLHQIAQMHRRQGQYGQALDAYHAALRGMKYALGDTHPNVAAILGNVGNLQKEYGDLDAAYDTYQEVLGIESERLGLSHPEVAISLHNVATIEAARGNCDHALAIYKKVIYLQRKLLGEDNVAVSVTAACMGDVHERLGDLGAATDCYEESLRVKSSTIGRHKLEVARVLHKLGKLSFQRKEISLADSYISRAVLIYRLNRLGDEHEWVFDAYRDAADIDAAMAMGGGQVVED